MKPLLLAFFLLSPFWAVRAEEPPPGFTLHPLNATGGEIFLPKGWEFQSWGTPTGWLYTLADKFLDDGSYDTGYRVQLVFKVKEISGGTPREVALQQRDKFKAAATRVLDECTEHEAGFFRRLCLETLELNPQNPSDDFHIIYTFSWNDAADLLTVAIFGAPQSQWAAAQKIHDVMGDFTIIDPQKMEAAAEPTPAPLVLEPKQLLGTWKQEDGKGTVSQVTYQPDGTFSAWITRKGAKLGDFRRKWSVEGDIIHEEYLQSTSDRIPVGTKDSDKVLAITPDHQDLLSERGTWMRYHRVPAP